MGLRRYGKYLLKRLERMTASPHAIAAGFAAGCAVSMFPLLGFHFILAFILTFLTRGSILASALGTVVGNPITFPLIFSASYKVGKWLSPGANIAAENMMHGHEIEDIMATMITQGIGGVLPIWQTMMIGAIPIGMATYVVTYFATRLFVTRSRDQRRLSRQRKIKLGEAADSSA
jgi:uncharacterized protein (DUF2062 family)